MKNLIFTIACLISLNAHSHEGHVHEPAVEAPPHGGLLRDALPFKSEVVLNGDIAKVYVYDKKLKPLKLDKPTLKGELQFPKDKNPKPVTFKLEGDHYEAKLPGISKVYRFDLHVYLDVGGKKALADFGIDNIN
ncbi:MAG: hypothetical protein SGI74_06600 [Oligoflexia bacterium]|nr:hypothetical protein [Oligoflexia bacterium]